ncbi:RimJ/RimL family protein N-acetyltransferase [Actinoplanes digitatis]|uniref:RimJ/RimL family protein N-acetyltransferase n=1 Tax=Actinoplanes digitatis TaxID=1868 RepID=A0A7W7HXY5_9ACTN|nr:RimJ/RimL family protein N-acetyltransferase [Actinoplanes digitatis]
MRESDLGTWAQAHLCRYLFAHPPVHRVEAGTQPENAPEQHALRKIGVRKEGVPRGAEFRDGARCDIVVFGLLRGEQPPD